MLYLQVPLNFGPLLTTATRPARCFAAAIAVAARPALAESQTEEASFAQAQARGSSKLRHGSLK